MNTSEIARVCHEVNRSYCESLGDYTQPRWDDAPLWQRESAFEGVEHLLANTEAKPCDSHESWLAKKEADGWVYGAVKDATAKTHPCVVPYEDLPREQQSKDYIFMGIVRALG